MAQMVGVSSHNQKVAGSIPSQRTCLGCRFDPLSECLWEATDQYFSHRCFFLSPFPTLSNENKIKLFKKEKYLILLVLPNKKAGVRLPATTKTKLSRQVLL